MTDLEKRAKEYANNWLEEVHKLEWEHKTDPKPEYIRIQQAYKDGATQETALLSQHILDLQKDKGNLTDRVRELEQQIEKMKWHKLVGSLEKKQNEIVEFIGKVAFLENDLNNAKAQIEKMKRCSTCKYSTDLGYCKIRCNGGECNKMDKWEMKEND